jgi:replicative DNA helicase
MATDLFDNLDNEKVILFHLLNNPSYFSKTFSKIKSNDFKKPETKQIFNSIKEFYSKFDKSPNLKETAMLVSNTVTDEVLRTKTINYFKENLATETAIKNFDFLIDLTKDHLKKVNLIDAVLDSAEQIRKDEIDSTIIGKFESALNYNFDKDNGMEFSESLETRFKMYSEKHQYMATGINALDDKLGGGVRKKSLVIVGGPSHSGKSAKLVAMSAGLSLNKYNGLYVTLEMPEKDILQRMDANLFYTDISEFENMKWEEYQHKYSQIKDYIGKTFVKEYPAGEFDVLELKSLMDDIEQENDIKLDYICVDYIGLMKSTRVTLNQGLYTYYKSIAEELHGFSKKNNIALLSATQLNRSAYGNIDAGAEAISDSIGIFMTADVSFNMLTNDELKANNQYVLKFEKNRYTGFLSKILMQAEFSKMTFKGVDDTNDGVSQINESTREMLEQKQVSELANSFGVPETDLKFNDIPTENKLIKEESLQIQDDFDDFEFD